MISYKIYKIGCPTAKQCVEQVFAQINQQANYGTLKKVAFLAGDLD